MNQPAPNSQHNLGPADGRQKMRLLDQLHTRLTPIRETPAWIDGDPLMEEIAAAVYEQCGTDPVSSIVVDDPRNIAAVAAAVARQRAEARVARVEALAADWEDRGQYGDASLLVGARAIRAALGQPTTEETR